MIRAKKLVRSFFTKKFSSFTYLNITQFLGALNDNIYKLLIVFFLVQKLGAENNHIILSTTGAVFVIPFLLFSSNSGTLADRFSKRNIIVLTKILELLVMSVGMLAFAFGSVIVSYVTLFLMATQSAIFGPSKYGIIPEIVGTERISRANGLMTSFTFLAIIIGTFLASFITDITDRNFILASLFCTMVSLAGVITSFGIEYTPPSGSADRFNVRLIYQIYETLKIAYAVPSMLSAIFGSAFFLFLGAFVQLNLIPFAMESLQLTDVQGGYLFLLTALGIGSGSAIAGRISGKTVELGLVPFSAFGITICLFAMHFFSHSLAAIIPLVIVTGLLGGMYQIPLDSYIQFASPNEMRGRIVAATNFLSFTGVLVASVLIYVLTAFFSLSAEQNFSVIGAFAFFVAVYFAIQFYDYFSRFVGMVLSRLHFNVTRVGEENIPRGAALYICTHKEWNDTLVMLGSQRLRMRFFIQQEQEHKPYVKRLYKFLRIVPMPEVETFEKNPELKAMLAKTLKKNISVCLFVDNPNLQEEVKKLLNSEEIVQVLKDVKAPLIPVKIEKGASSRFKTPAKIIFSSSEL